MDQVAILFPHQLFRENPALARNRRIYLVEENLFFNQYKFHKAKLLYHRVTMKNYAEYLGSLGYDLEYVDAAEERSDVRNLVDHLASCKVQKIHYIDPVDQWLSERLENRSKTHSIQTVSFESPMFLSGAEDVESYFKGKKRYFHNNFYIQQRKRLSVLLDDEDTPVGGKWSYDTENRKRFPRDKAVPEIQFPESDDLLIRSREYILEQYPDNPGNIDLETTFPQTHEQAEEWLDQFLKERFMRFGDYEDAMVEGEPYLHHSLLSPMMNVGLLTPREVIQAALSYGEEQEVPMNSLEGFIRQVIGWREFIRGVYVTAGGRQRTTNFWGFKRKIPASFWNGTTGIYPVDTVVKGVAKTGYAHHIERLMVLGNFMLLCEFDPDEVYRWFMELFIDSYDWVMVPNVYGMSQYADGGLMTTKPYISGSNYLLKMSDFPKGEWQSTWDALFWSFIDRHRDFFTSNPRSSMMVRNLDRMNPDKRSGLLEKAEQFLEKLDKS